MQYGRVLGRAWGALKSGVVWRFALTAFAAIALPFVLVATAVAIADLPAWIASFTSDASTEILAPLFAIYATMLVGGLLALPFYLIAYAGLVRAIDCVMTGTSITVAQLWSYGASRLGRLLAVEAVLYVIYMVVLFAIMTPFIFVTGLIGSSSEREIGSVLTTICLSEMIFFVVIMVAAIVYTSIESTATRYALIGDRTVGGALGAAFSALRAAWKPMIVFALIVFGLAYAWQIAASLVSAPLVLLLIPFNQLARPDASPEAAMALTGRIMWIYPVYIVIYLPFMVFWVAAWSAFFRRLTGLDSDGVVQPAPPVPVREAVGEAPFQEPSFDQRGVFDGPSTYPGEDQR